MTMLEEKVKVDEKKEQGIVTKFYGRKKLIDPETGEVYEVEFVEKQVKHTLPGGWRRVYTDELNRVFIGLYNKARRIEVVEFIISNLNLYSLYFDNKFSLSFINSVINEFDNFSLQS